MMRISDLDINFKRAVWSAMSMLTIILALAVFLRFVGYVLLGSCFLFSAYLSYDLFLKKYVVKMKEDKKAKKIRVSRPRKKKDFSEINSILAKKEKDEGVVVEE